VLAEPSIFQTVKKNKVKKNKDNITIKVEDADDDMVGSEGEDCAEDVKIKHRKNLEDGMRQWTQAITCRRETSNRYFNNPVALKSRLPFYSHWEHQLIYATELTVPCCDNCIREKQGNPDAILTEQEEELMKLIRHIETRVKSNEEPEIINVDCSNIEEAPQVPKKEGQRCGDRLQHCRKAIERWRGQCWHQHYEGSAWGPRALMSDLVVTKLATHAHIKALDTLRIEVPEWDFAERHRADVLAIIKDADHHYKQRLQEKNNQANRPKDKQKTLPSSRPVLQPVPHPFPQPILYPFPQQIPQLFPQPIPQPVPQSIPQSVPQPAYVPLPIPYLPQYAMYPPVLFPGYAPPPGAPPHGAWVVYPFVPPLQFSGPYLRPH
jgi:hypothetical protein